MNLLKSKAFIIAIAAVLSISVATMVTSTSLAQPVDERPSKNFIENKRYHDYEDGVFRVRAGAGGAVAPLTMFFPTNAEIKVGESVTWYNPTRVGEPHTVTFMSDPSYFAALDTPYIIANTTQLTPVDPAANAEPVIMPGLNGTNVVMVANARAYGAVSVGENATATYLPANATIHMDGTEKYVNSGLIWPAGQTPPGLPEIESFTVTFDEAGDYNYLCLLHPWMAGTVTVS